MMGAKFIAFSYTDAHGVIASGAGISRDEAYRRMQQAITLEMQECPIKTKYFIYQLHEQGYVEYKGEGVI